MTAILAAHADWSVDPRKRFLTVAAHLNSVGLPVRIGSLSVSKLLAHMKSDKKMRNGNLTFVLAHAIGHAFTSRDVPESVVRATLLANGAIDR